MAPPTIKGYITELFMAVEFMFFNLLLEKNK